LTNLKSAAATEKTNELRLIRDIFIIDQRNNSGTSGQEEQYIVVCYYEESLEELASHVSQIQKKMISEKFINCFALNEINVKFRPSKGGTSSVRVDFIEDGDMRQDFDR
jgi:hypothetical protein